LARKREALAMPTTDPMRREATANGFVAGAYVPVIAAGAVLAAASLISFWLMPPQLLLPTVCLAALATACAVGLIAWRSRARAQRRPNYWDVAGALTFIAMCAAILSEPDQVFTLFQAAPGKN
jgi:hypothetical protein